MRVERFDYELPPERIAQAPAAEREAARMLVVSPAGLVHRAVADLAEHVAPGTLVVVNDTKVLRARILGAKAGSGGKSEVFLVRKIDGDARAQRWRALGRASKGLRPGTRVVKGALAIEVTGKADDGLFEVELTTLDGASVDEAIRAAGQVPLPPYIKREPGADDEARYQTVFARAEGAVAAPTAGLHLTAALMERLRERGCEIATCTLHVGLGTFQPVMVDDLDDHPMHAEAIEVPEALVSAIARARSRGAPVLAIGTTVVRALESARDPERPGHVRACAEDTRLLIQPGYVFGVVDRLLTNFHLPKSTLLALVCAFAGEERTLSAYRAAIHEAYRFYSYGDAMLIDRAPPAGAHG
ncbi:MAG: tRNA preQ1(34) S-adenosylmethionine ribosyltransferase-isomerase QueA [Labilithrix sp.]|nr:tRNA preQ1(34) S-adenosylmethionine ribosyltransferase-isomerase QueA [Labilithrix sp.]